MEISVIAGLDPAIQFNQFLESRLRGNDDLPDIKNISDSLLLARLASEHF
jgi:hypothetical protein